jgi:hypothetical protein
MWRIAIDSQFAYLYDFFFFCRGSGKIKGAMFVVVFLFITARVIFSGIW